ncbi:MAG: hypothetical protein NVSMB66_3740 [Candidatus Doudnabacteria bacterium]
MEALSFWHNVVMSFFKLFYKISHHVIDSIKFNKGLNYILAILLTLIIVYSGLDILWYQLSINNRWIYNTGFVSVIAGGLIPIFVPGVIYIIARFRKNIQAQLLALTLGQASMLGLIISSFMKVFTGRVAPEGFSISPTFGGFRLGLYRGGVFSGWPSSHTTVAFSMATALIFLYPEKKWLKWVAFSYAFAIGIGVSVNIHWLSDAVAGALIGYAIGKKIGIDFRKLV